MTVTTSVARVVHNGDGTTTDFPVPFRFLENSHVAVFLRDNSGSQTLWAENTQYTISGAEQPGGGTVSVVTSPTDFTPASGEKLVVIRSVPITQETDYVENDPFPAETHERALDKLTMVNQEQTERLDRTFTIPETDAAAGNFVLPVDAVRASNFLAFDAQGGPIASPGPIGESPIAVSAYMETVLGSNDAAVARSSLGVIAASEATAGLIAVATQAETDAGVDDQRAVTPLKLANTITPPKGLFLGAGKLEATGEYTVGASTGLLWAQLVGGGGGGGRSTGSNLQPGCGGGGGTAITLIDVSDKEILPTDIDVGTDVITLPMPTGIGAFSLHDGTKVQFSTSGTAPGNIPTETDLWVVERSQLNIKLSLTKDGSAIDITSQGTGIHTIAVISIHGTIGAGGAAATGAAAGSAGGTTSLGSVVGGYCNATGGGGGPAASGIDAMGGVGGFGGGNTLAVYNGQGGSKASVHISQSGQYFANQGGSSSVGAGGRGTGNGGTADAGGNYGGGGGGASLSGTAGAGGPGVILFKEYS